MENRNTSLDDIAGIEALKDEMYELIKFLRDFQKYKDVGAAVPRGNFAQRSSWYWKNVVSAMYCR